MLQTKKSAQKVLSAIGKGLSATKLFSSQWLHQRNLSKDYSSVTLDFTAAMLALYQKNPSVIASYCMAADHVIENDLLNDTTGNYCSVSFTTQDSVHKLKSCIFIELSHHSILEANTKVTKKKDRIRLKYRTKEARLILQSEIYF